MIDLSFFDDSDYYTGPDLTASMVIAAQKELGYVLPDSYVSLLRVKNGGRPRKRFVRTPYATSWSNAGFAIEAIRGIGGKWGIESGGPLSSLALIREWQYPDVGIVLCHLPSGGHDTVMLDYSRIGGEPTVTYVDEDRAAKPVADSFAAFLEMLTDSPGGPLPQSL